jgi:hypothetical protein
LVRSLHRATSLLLILIASRAEAQTTPAPVLLTRAEVTFHWAKLAAADPRFTWNGRVRLDVDVLDTGRWRLAFVADYDAVVGGERRTFDLNQGTYVLDGTASRRWGATEISLLTRHVSRHLTDRENFPAISWNLAGARASHRRTFGDTAVSGALEAGRVMQQAFVDYLWTADLRLAVEHRLSPRYAAITRGDGGLVGTMPRVAGRPRLCGGRVEGAIRVAGAGASAEVFVAYERRVDAFPTDRFRVRLWSFGFRLAG